MGSFDSSVCLIARALLTRTVRKSSAQIRGGDMTSPAETALTLVVVKSVAIVGSALMAVLLLALFGAKKK